MEVRKDCVIIGSYRVSDYILRDFISSWNYDHFYWYCLRQPDKKECIKFMIPAEGREATPAMATDIVKERFQNFLIMFNNNFLEAWCFLKKCFSYCYFQLNLRHIHLAYLVCDYKLETAEAKKYKLLSDNLYQYIQDLLDQLPISTFNMEELSYIKSFPAFSLLLRQPVFLLKTKKELEMSDSDSE